MRRSVIPETSGLRQHIAPPESWPALVEDIKPDVAISALGTTIKQAGSQAAFESVDLDMVMAFARAARSAGARQMILVSSVGADPAASNFYLRTKGRVEAGLRALAFDRLDIVRPGLLLGDRPGPPRVGERIATLFSPVLDLVLRGSLDRYAAIHADIVGAAMVKLAGQTAPGVFVHENRALRRLADVSGA
nr:NAD-dependent dehydratase [Sphingobium boeckii]